MSKSLPQILPTDRPFWFCLRAQTKREHFAAIGLRKQYQITCFAPRLRMRKLTRRGAVWFVEAMFPGYFFAQFDHDSPGKVPRPYSVSLFEFDRHLANQRSIFFKKRGRYRERN